MSTLARMAPYSPPILFGALPGIISKVSSKVEPKVVRRYHCLVACRCSTIRGRPEWQVPGTFALLYFEERETVLVKFSTPKNHLQNHDVPLVSARAQDPECSTFLGFFLADVSVTRAP
ncbi:hypothetical protein BDR04DRAFT_269295 [Suillus decipiens]|nr:hypothetical protein BDR04DRAFT_269295 [Suillus decipiens]